MRVIKMTTDFFELERRLALSLGSEPRPKTMALVIDQHDTGVLFVDEEEFPRALERHIVIVEESTASLARSFIACLTQS